MHAWGNLDVAKVRHPEERRVIALSIAVNAAIVGAAAATVYLAPDLLPGHPAVADLVRRFRVAVVAALVLLPAVALLRPGLWAACRENSAPLGRDQVPEIFEILERHCRALGVSPPRLCVSRLKGVGLSTSFALAGRERMIVLGPELFAGLGAMRDRAPVLSFVLAQELGRIALGHASWWEDLLLGYLKRVPALRRPLLRVQTASRDRFALTLAPEGREGLVLLAVGGDLLRYVDADRFVRDLVSDEAPAVWAWMGALGRDEPHLAWRVRDLHRAGLLDVGPRLEERAGA